MPWLDTADWLLYPTNSFNWTHIVVGNFSHRNKGESYPLQSTLKNQSIRYKTNYKRTTDIPGPSTVVETLQYVRHNYKYYKRSNIKPTFTVII